MNRDARVTEADVMPGQEQLGVRLDFPQKVNCPARDPLAAGIRANTGAGNGLCSPCLNGWPGDANVGKVARIFVPRSRPYAV